MNCHKVTHLLSAFMDGELPGVEHRLIHQHLCQCRSCKAEYEGLLQLKRLLGRMRVQESRAELPAIILQRLAAEGSKACVRQPMGWFNELRKRWHQSVPPPPLVAFGAGLAAVGILFTIRVTDDGAPVTAMTTPGYPLLTAPMRISQNAASASMGSVLFSPPARDFHLTQPNPSGAPILINSGSEFRPSVSPLTYHTTSPLIVR